LITGVTHKTKKWCGCTAMAFLLPASPSCCHGRLSASHHRLHSNQKQALPQWMMEKVALHNMSTAMGELQAWAQAGCPEQGCPECTELYEK